MSLFRKLIDYHIKKFNIRHLKYVLFQQRNELNMHKYCFNSKTIKHDVEFYLITDLHGLFAATYVT